AAVQLELRDSFVLAVARGAQRSGRPLVIGPDTSSPGAGLVARLVRQARTRMLDLGASESARSGAIAVLSGLDPEESRSVFLSLLEPRQPLAVQVAVVQALAQSRSADLAELLLPRLLAFEPSVRAAAVRTLLSRPEWTKALL